MTQLFRKEAVDAQSRRLTGPVSLAQPLSLTSTVVIFVAVVVAMAVFLVNSHYARKATVQGFLRPDKGLIKSYAPGTGTIKQVFVQEGDFVEIGTPLVSIIRQRSLNSGEDLSNKLINELKSQANLLAEELRQLDRLEREAIAHNLDKQESLEKAHMIGIKQQLLLKEKLALFKDKQVQYQKLVKQGYLSELDYQQQQERHINVRQEAENLERTLLSQQEQLAQLEYEEKMITPEYQAKRRTIQQQQSELARRLSETETNYSYVVKATHSGIVTSIQVVNGETLKSHRPLLTILPHGAQLVAELLLPSRSAGFITAGDVTRMRFDAFPYQRFGFLTGKIDRIDKTLITQSDVDFPVPIKEPVYRLQAKLDQQYINAYGKEFDLKSGMLFNADIILDRRSLLEWILSPIYSLHGRLS
ncbi:HlyD family efflux transporter periplasmic adaptor subunit [Thalassomonas viridans]|uniref:HlyD family efflux transporter periplasmic adaptor subunit n=1 Tax=Thalassomonas viridans TaxID=137584 RepID=A0AAF0C864_9GAMM|nr:HlyD family efflux transporter periplasmic adaptor subunit [Thalassomonas viridans]WDE03885.1 HlyD family efflux transporter periplasmic adaptor subunit [Thalassomonas viridans]